MKIAWSIGHDVKHPGAYSEPLGQHEFDIAKKVVHRGISIILDKHPSWRISSPEILLPGSMTAGQVLSEKIRLINAWGADIAIESHFNSSVSPRAKGAETLYFSLPGLERFSKKGKFLAQCIQDNTVRSMEKCSNRLVVNRGAKGMADIRRIYNGKETFPRFAFLMKTKMPAVILEPLFISNRRDSHYLKYYFEEEIEMLANSVVGGIMKYSKGVW